MKQIFQTSCAEETRELARKIASEAKPGSVFALDGELGAGKTVFASGFARGLGIIEPVSSPTFTIVQEYPCGRGVFFHLDLYRIDHPDAALAFGIDEFLYASDGFTLVEWPERIEGLFPPHTVRVGIKRGEGEEHRIITIEQPEK